MQRASAFGLLCMVIALFVCSAAPISGEAPAAASLPEGRFVVRAYYDDIAQVALLARFDVYEYHNHEERYLLVEVGRAEYDELSALGFRLAIDQEQTANLNLVTAPPAAGPLTIPGYSCYRTVEETYQTAADLASNHPELASWLDVGDSWELSVGQPDGYDMRVLKLTNTAISGDKPRLLITASIHAREYAPAELATRFAEYLVSGYGSNADATWILDHHEIYVMFHANPDGRKEAEKGLSWRKNTNENYCGVTSSNRGADLNRNFNYQWGCCGGSSPAPCDATYRGPSAASEPETQAIQSYILALFPDQRGTGAAPSDATGVYIDLHSAAGLVIWPWGYTTTDPPNASGLRTLGRKFAYYNGYVPAQIADYLYVADGGSVDYSYGVLGIASLAFEVGTQFFQDCTSFNSTIVPNNLPALIYAAKVVRTPYLTSLGPDALGLALDSTEVQRGTPVTLRATVDDTRYSARNGTEPRQAVVAAEYYVDVPPWNGGTAHAMAANDGVWNATAEAVVATVDTTGWSAGRHIILVRGQDANGNWGAFSAIFVNIIEPTAVELRSFTASVAKTAITLRWETASEETNLGFNIYRAGSIDAQRVRLNAELIPSPYPGSPEGAAYSYVDGQLDGSKVYYYWLEALDIYGHSDMHGPLEVRVKAKAAPPGRSK